MVNELGVPAGSSLALITARILIITTLYVAPCTIKEIIFSLARHEKPGNPSMKTNYK
jgi:hypothetical protein